ncbi:MAG: ABC transporter substrate-binding protein, partial [Pseudomonadota bacterium]
MTLCLARLSLLFVLTFLPLATLAEYTLHWGRSSDSLTLDPMSLNDGPTHTMAHQIYEPLLLRNQAGALEPALATDWATAPEDPTVWIFNLRQGVQFHGGEKFDADDVVFSFERAQSENSMMQGLLDSVTEVRAVDPYTVEIVTKAPNPILPVNLTDIFIMSKDWAEANDTVAVQNFFENETTFAAANTNGTGPYMLVSYKPNVETVMTIHRDYWGKDQFPLDVTDIVSPVLESAMHTPALLAGRLQFSQDVPAQDLERLADAPNLIVRSAPQNRTILLGMNVSERALDAAETDADNPLSDLRVRQAMNLAIDRGAINRQVMLGQAHPAGMIAPPFV